MQTQYQMLLLWLAFFSSTLTHDRIQRAEEMLSDQPMPLGHGQGDTKDYSRLKAVWAQCYTAGLPADSKVCIPCLDW